MEMFLRSSLANSSSSPSSLPLSTHRLRRVPFFPLSTRQVSVPSPPGGGKVSTNAALFFLNPKGEKGRCDVLRGPSRREAFSEGLFLLWWHFFFFLVRACTLLHSPEEDVSIHLSNLGVRSFCGLPPPAPLISPIPLEVNPFSPFHPSQKVFKSLSDSFAGRVFFFFSRSLYQWGGIPPVLFPLYKKDKPTIASGVPFLS